LAKLFGNSGVRCLVNVDLMPGLAYKVGLAVAHAKTRKALMAWDTRVSGSMLEDAVVSGLLAGGVDAASVDVVPTPTLVPEYVTLRENIACRNDLKRKAVANIEKTIKSAFPAYMVF
jgi:phosphoglucosamine mutase